jgi:hypothetical protein
VTEKLTIQQIRQNEPETLWHFLQQLPASFEAQILLGLVLAGFLGAIVSWLVKWSSGDAHSLMDYCFRNSFKRTVASVLTFLGIIVGAIASDMFKTDSGEFVGWMNVLVNGFTVGFGSDASINKGKRVVWTEDKRAEASPR